MADTQIPTRARPDFLPPVIDGDQIACLGGTELLQLKAEPASVVPFGKPVKITWSVKLPAGCAGVRIQLNGKAVAPSGSMTVEPAQTTTYTLSARIGMANRVLGRTTVAVDTSACISGSIPESQVRNELRAAIDAVVASDNRLSQRRAASVEIEPGGVKVAVRLKIDVPNFADPDLDVDGVLGLRLRDGAVEPFFRSFSVDLDWPLWVTVVSLGASKFAEEYLESTIKGQLRRELLKGAKEAIDDMVDQLPGNLKLYRIATAQDRIDVTVCPVGDHVPHVVLGSGGVLNPHVDLD